MRADGSIRSRSGYFAHQNKRIVVGVAKEGHPQIVILELRNQSGLLFTEDTSRKQCLVRLLNIRNSVVDEGSRMIVVGLIRLRQHQPHTAAIEESHIAGFE